jgi:hypothetical protein
MAEKKKTWVGGLEKKFALGSQTPLECVANLLAVHLVVHAQPNHAMLDISSIADAFDHAIGEAAQSPGPTRYGSVDLNQVSSPFQVTA